MYITNSLEQGFAVFHGCGRVVLVINPRYAHLPQPCYPRSFAQGGLTPVHSILPAVQGAIAYYVYCVDAEKMVGIGTQPVWRDHNQGGVGVGTIGSHL